MTKIRAALLAAILAMTGVGLTACSSDSDVASKNLSKDADNFKILRRIVFYNGVTGDYILEVTGFCALGNYDSAGELSVTCKVGHDSYKKHFLGLSDNVSYFVEQTQPAQENVYHYKVIFRPETVLPDVQMG